jgi:23S rRNA pseudouridine2604 synthase
MRSPSTWLFYKPVGIECTTNLDVRNNIIDYINYPKRIFPIGRLDKASEGLIFMTNDGDIVNKILPETIMKRIYGNSKQAHYRTFH